MCFAASWTVLAKVDFAYPWLYDVLSIDQNIKSYGPRNTFRPAFEATDKAERVRLFAAINKAIHNSGHGLKQIEYVDPHGKVLGHLLRAPEIVHLQDVANLLDVLKLPALMSCLLWFGLVGGVMSGTISANLKQQAKVLGWSLLVLTAFVLCTGPTHAFYILHEWIFPAGHQWFFFYQESLMSMMMKAPDLFGPISLLLLLVAFMMFGVVNGVVSHTSDRKKVVVNAVEVATQDEDAAISLV